MISLEDQYRICDRLYLAPTPENLTLIKNKCAERDRQSDFFRNQLVSILTLLDELNQNFLREANTPNFALVKAAVLGYAEKQRVLGILVLLRHNTSKLGLVLDINPNLELIDDILQSIDATVPGRNPLFIRTRRN